MPWRRPEWPTAAEPEDRNPAELERVLLAHLDMLASLARSLTSNVVAAEDLVQDTALKAIRAWPSRPPREPGPWLATICLNTWRSDLRRAAARPVEVADDEALARRAARDDPAGQAVANVTASAVHEALAGLAEAQREAIALMDLCGFTAAEVAAMTGSPRGTVLARVHRGRKALAAALGPAYGPPPADPPGQALGRTGQAPSRTGQPAGPSRPSGQRPTAMQEEE